MNIGILLFEDVEVLDFAGPFEVFAVTAQLHPEEGLQVFTVAKYLRPIIAVNGLSVNPFYDFEHCPQLDLLVIPGGVGTRALLEDPITLDWIAQQHRHSRLTMSVCSGSRLLAALGLLDGGPYCTHAGVYEHMRELAPLGCPRPDLRYVQHGKIFTSAGISAGIDLSLHLVGTLFGDEVKQKTASYMEYRTEGN